jgi:hypothetical protein
MSRCNRSRIRSGYLLVPLGMLLLTCCGHPAPTTSSSPTPSTAMTSSDRVQTQGLSSARSGRLSAGPFSENSGHWTDVRGAKLWVASTVDEPTGATAIITADQVGTSRSVRVERNATERAQVPTVPTFFPGLLRLPAHGNWRIHVTIGKQTGCFLVRA